MNHKHALSYVLVDDDEDDRFIIRAALEEANRPLPVYEFENGQELLDFLDHNSSIRDDKDIHWLVVMDVNMPVLNGLETVKRIRMKQDWQNLPVLMFSTSSNQNIIDQAMQNGANGYIVKPASMNEYKDIFDRFFAPWLSLDTINSTSTPVQL